MGFATHLKVVPRLRMNGGAEPPHLNLIYLHNTCRENVPSFTAAALMVNKIFIKIPSLYFSITERSYSIEVLQILKACHLLSPQNS